MSVIEKGDGYEGCFRKAGSGEGMRGAEQVGRGG